MKRRPPLIKEELFTVANQLQAEGATVTALSLKKALGGGSLTTIYKYFAEWEASQSKEIIMGIDSGQPPEMLMNAAIHCWRLANMTASREMAVLRQNADEEAKTAQLRLDEALNTVKKLEKENELNSNQIQILSLRISELHLIEQAQIRDCAMQNAISEQLRQQVKSLQSEIELFHHDFDSLHQSYKSQLDQIRAELSIALSERDDALNSAADLQRTEAQIDWRASH